MIADVDIESEVVRGLGNLRFTIFALLRIAKLRKYRAKLWYKPIRENEESEEDFERKAEFKAHRKFMFTMGKLFKYTCWFMTSLFLYHYYVVMKK